MNIDGITLNSLIREFSQELEGNFLKKIQMPSNGRVYLEFSHKVLYASLLSSDCYCCFTKKKEPSLSHPNSFTMLLRKYLNGSRFISCKQLGTDRIMEIQFTKRDEIGDQRIYKLYFEIMGRNSNLILTDDSNMIIDAWKKTITDNRSVISGVEYVPYLGKGIQIQEIKDKDYNYLSSLFKEYKKSEKVSRVLQREFQGIGKQNLEEILYRASVDKATTVEEMNEEKLLIIKKVLMDLSDELKEIQLYVYLKEDSKTLLSPIPLLYAVDSGYDVKKMMPSDAVEFVNGKKRKSSVLNERKIRFLRILEKEHKKIESNVFNLEKDLLECSKAEELQFKAELIMGNIYKLNPKKNYEIVDVTDWNTGREKRIELNKKYNLSSNTQRMFKKSSKLKRRKDIVEKRISKLSKRLNYIEEIIHSIDLIETEDDLKEIKQEMLESGFIKEKILKKKGKTPKKITGIPRKFNYKEFEIFVGKNNRQNDRICHTFSREEYWFHAQKIPGSHVVINSAGREIPEDVLNMAARLAAYFSKGKNGTKIPVDYTKLKYVKKPKGGAPGFVIYDNFKTFIVDPMKVLEDIEE